MELTGVEVKAGEPLKVVLDVGRVLHLSQVSSRPITQSIRVVCFVVAMPSSELNEISIFLRLVLVRSRKTKDMNLFTCL